MLEASYLECVGGPSNSFRITSLDSKLRIGCACFEKYGEKGTQLVQDPTRSSFGLANRGINPVFGKCRDSSSLVCVWNSLCAHLESTL